MPDFKKFQEDILDSLGLDDETFKRLLFYRDCIEHPQKQYEGNCAEENLRGILVNVVGFSEEEAQEYIDNIG